MTYRFTKYGLINAALSLIPIFPLWTLFPGVGLAGLIGILNNNCELGYKIVLFICIVLTVCSTTLYLLRLKLIVIKKQKTIKRNFRWFSLLIYTLINNAALIVIIGPNLACKGDGQTILAGLLSGITSTIALIPLGFLVDLREMKIENYK